MRVKYEQHRKRPATGMPRGRRSNHARRFGRERSMARRTLLPATLVALVIFGMLGAVRPAPSTAQDAPETVTSLMQVGLEAGELPIAPSFVRLLRITMEPDSQSP